MVLHPLCWHVYDWDWKLAFIIRVNRTFNLLLCKTRASDGAQTKQGGRGRFASLCTAVLFVISPKHHQYFTTYNACNQSTMDQLQREEQKRKKEQHKKQAVILNHKERHWLRYCMYNTIYYGMGLLMMPSTAMPWQLYMFKRRVSARSTEVWWVLLQCGVHGWG